MSLPEAMEWKITHLDIFWKFLPVNFSFLPLVLEIRNVRLHTYLNTKSCSKNKPIIYSKTHLDIAPNEKPLLRLDQRFDQSKVTIVSNKKKSQHQIENSNSPIIFANIVTSQFFTRNASNIRESTPLIAIAGTMINSLRRRTSFRLGLVYGIWFVSEMWKFHI